VSPRYETHVDPSTGRTMKSGLNLHEEGVEDDYTPKGGIYRAVIINTYATDDGVRTEGERSGSTRLYEIECDILLTRSLVPFRRVPVLQPDHGVHDAGLWIPRPSTRVIGDQDLNFRRVSARGTLEKLPPNLEDVDGDKVLVQFIEGDPEKPIITGAMTHPKTKRLFVDGDGWSEGKGGSERGTPHKNEKYLRYRGVECRINDQGDVLVDTVAANHAKDDTETPNPLTGGQLRLRLKSTQRFTVEMDGTDVLEVWQDPLTKQVHIDLGEGASESIVRGEKLTTWLLAHFHPDAMGGTLPPIDPAGAVSLLAGDHLSDDHKVK
jgi:hypothetical protein